MARPSKLTPEVQKKLCDAIRAGNYFNVACDYAGIDYSTFRKWMKKGEKAKGGRYFEFFNAIKKALAESEIRDVAIIAKAAEDNWQAAAWRLERRFPERWARKDRFYADINHSGQVNVYDAKQELIRRIKRIKARRNTEDRE